MAQPKIELKLGNFQFTGEAEAAWLEKQLDKLLEHVKNIDPAGSPGDPSDHQTNTVQHETKETLSAYLSSCGATTNQVKKFLATACWLMLKGSKRLAPSDIAKALSDNRQGKLANPSECRSKNIAKGYCVKDGKQFYVNDQGFASLGKKPE